MELKNFKEVRQLIRKNFESDFTLTVKLSTEIGDSDFRLAFTTSGKAVYTAERKGGELSPNIADAGDGMYLVTFRKHGLEPGLLRMKSFVFVKNDNSPDGEMAEVSANQCLGIELWEGMSDEVELPKISLLPTVVYEKSYENLIDKPHVNFHTLEGNVNISNTIEVARLGNKLPMRFSKGFRHGGIIEYVAIVKPKKGDGFFVMDWKNKPHIINQTDVDTWVEIPTGSLLYLNPAGEAKHLPGSHRTDRFNIRHDVGSSSICLSPGIEVYAPISAFPEWSESEELRKKIKTHSFWVSNAGSFNQDSGIREFSFDKFATYPFQGVFTHSNSRKILRLRVCNKNDSYSNNWLTPIILPQYNQSKIFYDSSVVKVYFLNSRFFEGLSWKSLEIKGKTASDFTSLLDLLASRDNPCLLYRMRISRYKYRKRKSGVVYCYYQPKYFEKICNLGDLSRFWLPATFRITSTVTKSSLYVKVRAFDQYSESGKNGVRLTFHVSNSI